MASKMLTFEDLLALPNGERIVDIYNGVESIFTKVGSLQGNVFLCPYLSEEGDAKTVRGRNKKGHVFLLIENNGIDLQIVKKIILAQLKEAYDLKVQIVGKYL